MSKTSVHTDANGCVRCREKQKTINDYMNAIAGVRRESSERLCKLQELHYIAPTRSEIDALKDLIARREQHPGCITSQRELSAIRELVERYGHANG